MPARAPISIAPAAPLPSASAKPKRAAHEEAPPPPPGGGGSTPRLGVDVAVGAAELTDTLPPRCVASARPVTPRSWRGTGQSAVVQQLLLGRCAARARRRSTVAASTAVVRRRAAARTSCDYARGPTVSAAWLVARDRRHRLLPRERSRRSLLFGAGLRRGGARSRCARPLLVADLGEPTLRGARRPLRRVRNARSARALDRRRASVDAPPVTGGTMRCPKCHYVSFDGQNRCRNCGYDFSLSQTRRRRVDRSPVSLRRRRSTRRSR